MKDERDINPQVENAEVEPVGNTRRFSGWGCLLAALIAILIIAALFIGFMPYIPSYL